VDQAGIGGKTPEQIVELFVALHGFDKFLAGVRPARQRRELAFEVLRKGDAKSYPGYLPVRARLYADAWDEIARGDG
jgi:hypothetical protein